MQIDRLSELTGGMSDLLTDLLDEGPRQEWTAREEATWKAAEEARQLASRCLPGATAVGFQARLYDLLSSEWKVLRSLRKVATRLWACPDGRASSESEVVRDLALVLSAVVAELRAAMACLASGSRRPKALEHCSQVRRLSRATRDVGGPLATALVAGEPSAIGKGIAWEATMVAMRRAADACVDTAALIEIAVTEA